MKTNKIEIARPAADQRTNDEIFVRMIEPEEQLMISVLEEGVADFQRFIFARDKKSARCFAEAESWILSDDNDWVFSFSNCCAVLGVEPSYLRKGLLAWRQAQLMRAAVTPQPRKNIFRKAA